MRQSKLFTKTRREAPADEQSKNAQLLIRGGYLHKHMSGVYEYMPLGLRVFKKIEQIIREEMNAVGAQEILLSTLQDAELWKKTGRWDDEVIDNWFKTKLANGTEVGIANTHEEPLTSLLCEYVHSYKDLPLIIYQFQNKFRNELRAKSGIMRVREFVMKDMYSFSRTEEDFKDIYEKCAAAYTKIFERVGLGDVTFRTIAAGGSFTTGLTDEYQTITDSGEDIIYIDDNKKLAINKEVYNDENIKKFGLNKDALREAKSVEVGNIFPLGTKYTDALNLHYKDENGVSQKVIMGCYGIGLGRLLGTVADVYADEKGLVWPEAIAPFKYHIIEIPSQNAEVRKAAEALYERLSPNALYDDREARAGEKFADADLLGMPYSIVVSERGLAEGKVELKDRKTGEVKSVSLEEVQ
jgi:prolyl-tRNA synthetase